MGLLQKLFSKKEATNEFKIAKSELFIYAEGESTLQAREDKDYFKIGYFNEDRTIFTDVANDKTYQFSKSYIGTLNINFDGRLMNSVGTSHRCENVFKNGHYVGCVKIKPSTYAESKDFQWLADMIVGTSYYSALVETWVSNAENKDLKKFFEFIMKGNEEEISETEIKEIAKGLNNYAYKYALKLEKDKEKTI